MRTFTRSKECKNLHLIGAQTGYVEMSGKNQFLYDMETELTNATEKFGSFNSHHEAYAIIQEELDEYWDKVKAIKPRSRMDHESLREELLQTATMCWRAALDLGLEK